MKKTIYKLWSKFLTIVGDIKIFKFPMFIVYDPDYFEVDGEQVLKIIDTLRPGDIILRGYNYYLDGKFIPSKAGWSHGAIYIGDNKIIHAIAEGVSETNVVDFTRCDRIAIFRPKKGMASAIRMAKKYLEDNTPYDFGFERGVSAIYCFELCGECYSKLDIPRKTVKKLFGLIKKENVFIADSFFDSPDLECVYQFNPEYNVNYCKE